MSLVKPRTMPGVLELSPLEQVGFQSMLDSVRGSFERFGFLPIETPVIELTEVLLTKTGGETERQVYFVQSTGALAAGAREQSAVPELALRYDLTVPLARYVAEREAELSFPFRRYQIQRVYRGERAQRGRFREFYQCDIDVVGKDQLSVRYDAELPAVIYSVFQRLGVGKFTIHLNHRKLLRGFFEGLGLSEPELQTRVLREVDKLDKRGEAHVRETLSGEALGLSTDQIERVLGFVALRSSSLSDALAKIEALGAGSETLEQGKRELSEVLRTIANLGVPEDYFKLNFSIARGLDYYTGIVYETLLDEYPAIGSVCSGGRYENLAGHYTKSRLPGVGISIGATRLYWQLREAGLFGERKSTVQALVAQLDEGSLPVYLELGTELREAGINTEVVLEPSKLGKQFKYADRAKIRFVLVLGSDELAAGTVSVKDLEQQTQITVPRAELVARLRGELG